MTEARPGDEIVVETVLAPYRGERSVRQIAVKIPTSASKGTLHILVSDGDTLDRVGRGSAAFGRNMSAVSTAGTRNTIPIGEPGRAVQLALKLRF